MPQLLPPRRLRVNLTGIRCKYDGEASPWRQPEPPSPQGHLVIHRDIYATSYGPDPAILRLLLSEETAPRSHLRVLPTRERWGHSSGDLALPLVRGQGHFFAPCTSLL